MRIECGRRMVTAVRGALGFALLLVSLGVSPLLAQDRGEVQIDRNVVYGMVSGAALLMDVYQPREPNGIGVVWIWGSGWQMPPPYATWVQLKARGVPQVMMDMGYTVFVPNHRAAPMFRYPAAVEDVQRAVRFTRHNAESYGLDPDRLGGWGSSSGGHLVGMLATLDGAGDPDHIDPVEHESSKLQAVIMRAAPTSLADFDPETAPRGIAPLVSFIGSVPGSQSPAYREASPVSHVTPDDPPILLVHGAQDRTVPVTQAETMFSALEQAGVEVKLVIDPEAGHGAGPPWEDFRWLNGHLLGPEEASDVESVITAHEILVEARHSAQRGQIVEAVAGFEAAADRDARLTITAWDWNWLCWRGGLWELPELVIHACDRAVESAPRAPGRAVGDPSRLEFHDSRGLVRGLLGDAEGAIEDFQIFIAVVDNPRRKAERESWVAALEAGENPFTHELLREIIDDGSTR